MYFTNLKFVQTQIKDLNHLCNLWLTKKCRYFEPSFISLMKKVLDKNNKGMV